MPFMLLFIINISFQIYFIKNLKNNLTNSLHENYETLLIITHFLFLLSRFGDSFLLIRLPYLVKKYFPCWCHFNSKLLRKHKILSTKNSDSSNNEPLSPSDIPNTTELRQQETIEKSHWKQKNRRFRLKFQFIPLWSHNRPRLFKESV
jgi:hypothetical protein